ncbi:MAG: hypothetical protein WAK92_11515 [Thiobacillus sp.]
MATSFGLMLAAAGLSGACLANPATDPGRLFYTPEQRAQLEAARDRNVTQTRHASPTATPAPLRFDGMVIRSDGKSTSWVNGRPQVGASGVKGLKPGQIQADGKVYEPYQILRSSPEKTSSEEAKP